MGYYQFLYIKGATVTIEMENQITQDQVVTADAKPHTVSLISDHVNSIELQKSFNKHWHAGISDKTENLEVIAKPFRVCRIFNFLNDNKFIQELKAELKQMNTSKANMDLYQFKQTGDFVSMDSPCVKALRDTFLTELSQWMQNNTKIELSNKLSMSSSWYHDCDYLLCHDDNNEDRRIAFIFYLSEDWKDEYGGQLALFDTDENGLPRNVVKKLTPAYNSLVFFEVVNNSYHQVLEVLTKDKSRWSINGWFHGPLPETISRPKRPSPKLYFESLWNQYTFLDFWLDKNYLSRTVGHEINKELDESSVALLSNFLQTDQYLALSDDVRDENIKWTRVGPPDIRNYEVADIDSLPNVLRSFINFLKSKTFLTLLHWYTECDILPDNNSTPKINVELQKWSKGSYSLIDQSSSDDKAPSESDDTHESTSIDDYMDSEYDVEDFYEDTEDVNQPCCSNSNRNAGPSRSRDSISRVNNKASVDTSDEDEDGPSEAKKQKLDPYLSNRTYSENGTSKLSEQLIIDTPSSSKPSSTEVDETISASTSKESQNDIENHSAIDKSLNDVDKKFDNDEPANENHEATKKVTDEEDDYTNPLVKRGATLKVEKSVKNYEILMYMIRNKKVVLPFKDTFRDLIADREEFYKFIFNYEFELEKANQAFENISLIEADSDDLEMMESCEKVVEKFNNEKEKFESVINGILDEYAEIEKESLGPKKDKKCGEFEILMADPYEDIVKREIENTKNTRTCLKVDPKDLPKCSLEVMMPFNPLMGAEKQYVYYIDPQEKDSKKAILISVPMKPNYLSIVYKEKDICHVQKYINHYASHEFYNLVITYHEKNAFNAADQPVDGEDADCESNEE
ncbi:prolyl 3-hydroxylase sudestada1 [Copidosoma floridanum]|uniref:prolyl 3-hydroxylase sudestada1 n=1 Tax=Copidosoma floridanum TaxID=29053 RepID=UPI0006C991B8|nr:prolyl 3-hydroxylase sudestada1 [Copidosoma floridanum]